MGFSKSWTSPEVRAARCGRQGGMVWHGMVWHGMPSSRKPPPPARTARTPLPRLMPSHAILSLPTPNLTPFPGPVTRASADEVRQERRKETKHDNLVRVASLLHEVGGGTARSA